MASQTIDDSDDARAVALFAAPMTSPRCSACISKIPTSEDGTTGLFSDGGESSICCPDCCTTTCLGCGETLLPKTPRLGTVTTNGLRLSWHCEAALPALIWALLCGYDCLVKHNKQPPKSATTPTAAGANSAKAPSKGGRGVPRVANGVGYSLDSDYAWGAHLDSEELLAGFYGLVPATTPSKKRGSRFKRYSGPSLKIDPDDDITMKAMSALAVLLPSPTRLSHASRYDRQPPAVLTSLFLQSSILDKAADLLRNNSFEDVTRRFRLYSALFRFVRALATGPTSIFGLLHKQRPLSKLGHNLAKTSYRLPTRLTNESEEFGQPLVACMRDLADQSVLITKQSATTPDEFQSAEGRELLMMATNIKECAEIISQGATAPETQPADAQDADRDPYAWQKDLAVLPISLDVILKQYHLTPDLEKVKPASVGRMRRLLKEITTLKTSLPPNIFVRYAETRPDVMKAVMVGPGDSPYEHGLFEFDIFCPYDYPTSPPQMFFCTTDGGRVSLNPNLYPDGKVCLSLLGTWQGEPWIPGHSTLLQVLVSIQAMVLCARPYANEPGRETMAELPVSLKFNRDLHSKVIKTAMLAWIPEKKTVTAPEDEAKESTLTTTQKPEDNEIFQEIARQHFRRNHVQIITTVRAWVAEKMAHSAGSAPRDIGGHSLTNKQKKRKMMPAAIPPVAPRPSEDYIATQEQKYGAAKDVNLRDELLRCLKDFGKDEPAYGVKLPDLTDDDYIYDMNAPLPSGHFDYAYAAFTGPPKGVGYSAIGGAMLPPVYAYGLPSGHPKTGEASAGTESAGTFKNAMPFTDPVYYAEGEAAFDGYIGGYPGPAYTTPLGSEVKASTTAQASSPAPGNAGNTTNSSMGNYSVPSTKALSDVHLFQPIQTNMTVPPSSEMANFANFGYPGAGSKWYNQAPITPPPKVHKYTYGHSGNTGTMAYSGTTPMPVPNAQAYANPLTPPNYGLNPTAPPSITSSGWSQPMQYGSYMPKSMGGIAPAPNYIGEWSGGYGDGYAAGNHPSLANTGGPSVTGHYAMPAYYFAPPGGAKQDSTAKPTPSFSWMHAPGQPSKRSTKWDIDDKGNFNPGNVKSAGDGWDGASQGGKW